MKLPRRRFLHLAAGACRAAGFHSTLEGRKATLEMMLAKAGSGIRFNEHMEGDGETVFRHACKLGLEGIVSKRKDSPHRSAAHPICSKFRFGQLVHRTPSRASVSVWDGNGVASFDFVRHHHANKRMAD
jgi:hypothetical protein